MTLEIQVLAGDRDKNVAGFNRFVYYNFISSRSELFMNEAW